MRDRPSRFDKRVEFGLPGLAERMEFIKKWSEMMGKKEMMVGDRDDAGSVVGSYPKGFHLRI